jgi:hypothetical protein
MSCSICGSRTRACNALFYSNIFICVMYENPSWLAEAGIFAMLVFGHFPEGPSLCATAVG